MFLKRYDSTGLRGWGSANNVIGKELVKLADWGTGRHGEDWVWNIAAEMVADYQNSYYYINIVPVKVNFGSD